MTRDVDGGARLPADAGFYKRTPTFTEATVPSGLLKEHRTKPGVWAKIVVESGQLRFRCKVREEDVVLTPERPGIVQPEVVHDVAPIGVVRFHVEFYRLE
jgi:tellurite resistance-related uncharacterized protein